MPANQLPLTFDAGNLPLTGQGYTPQQLLDFISENARIFTGAEYSLFTSGSTAPTSDSGPWASNGNTWYYWDSVTGSYVPFLIPQERLKFYVGSAAPDETIYLFWIQTAVDGQPLALKTYYSGAWVDVYASQFANYSTTAQMYAAIAAAIATVTFDSYPAQATTLAPQSIAIDATPHKITLDIAPINPAPAPFNTGSSRYIAPANGIYQVSVTSQFDNDTGDASLMQVCLDVYKNNLSTGLGSCAAVSSPPGSRWFPGFTSLVSLNTNDYLELWVEVTDGTNTGNIDLTTIDFNVTRVSA